MATLTLGVPGAPALAPTYIAEVTSSGPLDVSASLVTSKYKIVPAKNFSLNKKSGLLHFFKGMARVVDARTFIDILSIGGAALSSGQLSLGGTITTGDVITTTVILGATTAPVAYTVVSGDTTLTILAGHIAAAIVADSVAGKLVSAAGSTTHVVVTALATNADTYGTNGNAITIRGSLSGGATETYTPTTNTALTGGTNGSLIN